MPSIKGKPKVQLSYKCPHDLLQKINEAIENGEYASRNDVITAALISFFRDEMYYKNHMIDWLISEEGEKLLKNHIRTVLQELKLETRNAQN